ncbi:hypothetical protein LVJ94_50685 [Pendulispora rubella]|uniref:Uncharacterized protein n=1 Tax=Pendulispora rubella TaxID=2741070 RepID=A0ABZ2L2I1_9BACT
MNSLRNLPIILQYEEDGMVHAHCPLVAGCECKAPTRNMALRQMEQILKRARDAGNMNIHGRKYEVVHLAIAPTTTGGFGGRKLAEKPQRESGTPRIES